MIGIDDSSARDEKSNRAKDKFSEREVSFFGSRLSTGGGEERKGASITQGVCLMDDYSTTHC